MGERQWLKTINLDLVYVCLSVYFRCDPYKHCQDPSQIDCGNPQPPPPGAAQDTCDTSCHDGHSIAKSDLYVPDSNLGWGEPKVANHVLSLVIE